MIKENTQLQQNTFFLNLDKAFNPSPTHQEIAFEMMQFYGGEMHIKLDNNLDYSKLERVIITNRFRNGDDTIKVLIANDALKRKGVKHIELVMPYIPSQVNKNRTTLRNIEKVKQQEKEDLQDE